MEILLTELPAIRRKLESPQWEHSEKILDIKFYCNVSIEELAYIADLNVQEYVGIEWCDIGIPVKVYVDTLSKLQAHFDNLN